MNILSNILKIDYKPYIINDNLIKKNIIDKFFIHNKDKEKYYHLSVILKYNNIFYIYYFTENDYNFHIYSYDNIKFKTLLLYNDKNLIHFSFNKYKYTKEHYGLKEITIYHDYKLKYIKKKYFYYNNHKYINIYNYYNNIKFIIKEYNETHKLLSCIFYINNYKYYYYYYKYKIYITCKKLKNYNYGKFIKNNLYIVAIIIFEEL